MRERALVFTYLWFDIYVINIGLRLHSYIKVKDSVFEEEKFEDLEDLLLFEEEKFEDLEDLLLF
jgi:hypothetical protein